LEYFEARIKVITIIKWFSDRYWVTTFILGNVSKSKSGSAKLQSWGNKAVEEQKRNSLFNKKNELAKYQKL
jgi:hypothetical protein